MLRQGVDERKTSEVAGRAKTDVEMEVGKENIYMEPIVNRKGCPSRGDWEDVPLTAGTLTFKEKK